VVPRSRYGEWAPPAELAPWVACFWSQEIAPGDPYPQRVLPDGCVDLVLFPDRQVRIAGPATSSVTVEMPAGTTTHGIRFRPGRAGAALGLPAAEVLDADAPIEVAWPDWASLERPLTAELTRRLRTRSPDELVAEAVRRLQLGGSRVHDLASDLGIGERHLRRRFHEAVGYAPKTLDRVLRLQRFLRLAEQPDPAPPDLAITAALTGYADQSHLVRDCRRLAGLTPTELLASRAA
jgi:AraC-like DNA-binding protein